MTVIHYSQINSMSYFRFIISGVHSNSLGQMDKQIDICRYRYIDIDGIDKQMDVLTKGWNEDGYIDLDGQKDGWINKWMNRQMNGQIDE